MSAVARELQRHTAWIRQRAEALYADVVELEALIYNEQATGQGWSQEQAEAVWAATRDWGDNCGRAIESAKNDVERFAEALTDAYRR